MAARILKTLTNRLFRRNGHALRPVSLTGENVTPKKRSTPVKAARKSPSRRSTKKKVLMFGWELPPFNSGGLGVACYELAHAMADQGADITFVLPKRMDVKAPFMRLRFANDDPVTEEDMRTLYNAYRSSADIQTNGKRQFPHNIPTYGLLGQVKAYAQAARKIAQTERFDIIHAHDWLCYPAGMMAKRVGHKPLVSHVHATEFDRGGGNGVNQDVYNIERAGMHESEKVIAVSNFTKNLLVDRYGLPQHRIDVVHNGVNASYAQTIETNLHALKRQGKKLVLYVGRITLQKGPDYFLQAARRVLQYEPNALFIMAGSGDMERQMMMMAAGMGISDKVMFTGFLRGDELNAVYQAADVFVMPSVSEPFGISTLESMVNRTPAIVSRQSGVSEVLTHALKVDFWDVDDLVHKIVSVLRYNPLKECLGEFGSWEAAQCSWEDAASKCIGIYEALSV